MSQGVIFDAKSAQRIGAVVKAVERSVGPSLVGEGENFLALDLPSIGIVNNTATAFERGQIVERGAWVREDTWAAAEPSAACGEAYIVAGIIPAGAAGRAWCAGVRRVQYKARADGYGPAIAEGMRLGPVKGIRTASYEPHGPWLIERILQAPAGVLAGIALARIGQRTGDQITENAAKPGLLAEMDVNTATAVNGVALKVIKETDGRVTLSLQAG